MKVAETDLPGVLVLEPAVFRDARGRFLETWSEARYRAAGLPGRFVQDNVSVSHRGVLRGLHYQLAPHAQGKLVGVLEGEIFDVAVDLRAGSPTFGRWTGVLLSSENARQLYIPEGFAHGFAVTSERAVVSYKCTAYYNREAEASLRWDDPDVGIAWPITDPILSEKDAAAPGLQEIARAPLQPHSP